jgi:DnaK suppressor protein
MAWPLQRRDTEATHDPRERAGTEVTPPNDELLRSRLAGRLGTLRAKLAGDLVPEPEASFTAIAGEVRDAGDESVAIEQIEIRGALMERDAGEIGELAAAIERLDNGSYGWCVECGLDIDARRLEAMPAARRCSTCQTRFEHRGALLAGR